MKSLLLAAGVGATLLALPASASDDALTALRAVTVATPAAGLPYADVLQQAGQPERATLLRLGLLSAHVDGLNGRAWPSGTTLGQVIDGAVGLPAPAPDSALAAAWHQAFNRHVVLRWGAAGTALPQELLYLRDRLQPVGPGAWTMNSSGLTNYVAVVTLINRSPTPLPLPPFRLRLLPDGGFVLDCKPPLALAAPATAGGHVAAGGERGFVCRAVTDGRWRDAFARQAQGQATDSERFDALPADFDHPERVADLIAALGSVGSVDRTAWQARFSMQAPPAAAQRTRGSAAPDSQARDARGARESPLRTLLAVAAAASALLLGLRLAFARAGGEPLSDTVRRTLPWLALLMGGALAIGSPWGQDALSAWTAGANQRLRDGAEALRDNAARAPSAWRLDSVLRRLFDRFGVIGVGAAMALLLFFAGRLFVRRGQSSGGVVLGTWLLLAVGGAATVVGTWTPPSGDGWGRAAPLIVAAMIVGVFFWVGVAVVALHRLHDLLDRDGISWPASVVKAFRQALDFAGTAARAEFWGYVAAFVLAWAVARAGLRPMDIAVAVVGLLPLPALCVRRFRALDARETWGLAALVVLIVLELLTNR